MYLVRTRDTRAPASGFTGATYDAVLLDHEVQDGRGLEWLEDLCERAGFPPVVYFAPADVAVADRALQSGAAHVLVRTDFEHAQLAAVLRNALARRQNVLAHTSGAALEPPAPDRFGSVRIRGHRCLRRLAEYAAGERAIEGVLAALRDYELIHDPRTDRGERYRETLEARPWEACRCEICRQLGHHVVLFRGAERNRRRGSHNVWTFYRRLQRGLAA